MREMRRAKREVTDAGELRGIVEACRTVRLGLVDAEGVFIVPMSFGYDWPEGDGGARITLWLHSAGAGRRTEALLAAGAGTAAGAPVAIEMDVEDGVTTGDYACAYSFAYRSIMGSGRARRIDGSAEKRRGLERIMDHLAPGAPVAFSPEAIDRVTVWRVDVERFRGKRRV